MKGRTTYTLVNLMITSRTPRGIYFNLLTGFFIFDKNYRYEKI